MLSLAPVFVFENLYSRIMSTYDDKDDLKDGTSFVSSPIGIAKECPGEREDVDGPGPFANIIGSFSILLLKHSRQEQYQVHSNTKER